MFGLAKSIKDVLAKLRAVRAVRMRRQIKRQILLDDLKDWRAGKKTSQESLAWRNHAYAEVDKMTDEEILNA